MAEQILAPVLASATAGAAAACLGPWLVRLAGILGVVDRPGGRKTQPQPVPCLGGVAIAVGLTFGAVTALLMVAPAGAPGPGRSMVALAVATAMVFLMGLVDDVVSLRWSTKLALEFLAATVVVWGGWVPAVALPGGPVGELCLAVGTIVFLVGLTNAFNMLDGQDGLAGSLAAIMAAALGLLAFFTGAWPTALLMAATAGAALGFLRHNRAPARLYLGDSGSLTLGFVLGAAGASLTGASGGTALAPALVLSVPMVDMVVVVVWRFLGTGGQAVGRRLLRVLAPDRSHLHHLLGEMGLRAVETLALVRLAVGASCAAGLVVAWTDHVGWAVALLATEVFLTALLRVIVFPSPARATAVHPGLLRRPARERGA